MRRILPSLPLLLPPLLLLREAFRPGFFPGQAFGEGWGRLFAMGQVARWFAGLADPGTADLLAFPAGRLFWPVDPLTTGLAAAIGRLGGGSAAALAAGLTAVVLLHLLLTGLGVRILARTAGAGTWGATAAGLAAQVHPFLMRSGQDGVVEVLALGPLALLAAAILHACRAPGWRASGLVLAAGAATALTSPYYAAYAVLLWALLVPVALWRRVARAWAGAGLALALACALAAAPLIRAEAGPGGRLDPRFGGGGYRLAPTEAVLVSTDGALQPEARSTPPGPAPEGAATRDLRVLQAFPGGLACALALGLGCATRRGRAWALVAAALFLLGVGPQLVARTFLPPVPVPASPLQELLQVLPLTRQLGNAQRLVVLYLLPALVAGAVACGAGWRRALALGALAVAEFAVVLPGLRLATTAVDIDEIVLAALAGPVVTFPVGDPPTWNRGAPPKRALFLAAVHGQPVAGDYGRGGRPTDLDLVVELSSWAGVGVDRRAAETSRPSPDPPGFTRLLLLFEGLEPRQRDALRAQARARWGPPLAASAWGEVHALGGGQRAAP